MKITNQILSAGGSWKPKSTPADQGKQFQTDLEKSRAAQDTFTHAAPAKGIPVNVTVFPSDSTEVKLNKLRQIGETADYSGMSYVEIHTAIWNRYNAAFDGKMSAIASGLTDGKEWCDISNQFMDEVYHAVALPMAADEKKGVDFGQINPHAKMLGYDGMSWEEREAAIKEKYKGKDTLEDFLSMQGELSLTGVLSEKMGNEAAFLYQSILRGQITRFVFPDEFLRNGVARQSSVDAALNKPFNQQAFYERMKMSLDNMTFPASRLNIKASITTEVDEALSAFSLNAEATINNLVDKFLFDL